MADQGLFKDVEEVSLFSGSDPNSAFADFYPTSQPFIGQVILKIPKIKVENDTLPDIEAIKSLVADADVLEDRPQNLLNFEYNRLTKGVGTFSITLFDPTWELEETIVHSKGVLGFQYGYSQQDTLSPLYIGKVLNYSIEFKLNGVILCLTGLTLGMELALVKEFNAESDQLISDIVKNIALDAGYAEEDIYIEPTVSVLRRDDLEDTGLKNKLFNKIGISDLKFIKDHLIPLAIGSDTKQGCYEVFSQLGNKGTQEFHFHTQHFKCPTEESKIKGFSQYKNKNSPVISFKPSWDMTVAQFGGGGGTFHSAIDINSKEVISVFKDAVNTSGSYDGNSPNSTVETPTDKSNAFDPHKNQAAFSVSRSVEHTQSLLEAQSTANFSKNMLGALKAKLEIFGTHKIKFLEKIAVIMYIPGKKSNGDTEQLTHWISGYYRVVGITDIITKGSFVTYLDLMTAGRQIAEDKVKE